MYCRSRCGRGVRVSAGRRPTAAAHLRRHDVRRGTGLHAVSRRAGERAVPRPVRRDARQDDDRPGGGRRRRVGAGGVRWRRREGVSLNSVVAAVVDSFKTVLINRIRTFIYTREANGSQPLCVRALMAQF